MYGVAAGFGATAVARVIDSTLMPDNIYLPVFNITPEEIFENEIWLFDVNFFEPETEKNYKLQKDAAVDTIDVKKEYSNNSDEGYGYDIRYRDFGKNAKNIKGDETSKKIEITSDNGENFSNLIEDVNNKIKEVNEGRDKEEEKLEEISADTHYLILHTADVDEFEPNSSSAAYNQAHRKVNVGLFVANKEDNNNYLKIVFKSEAYSSWDTDGDGNFSTESDPNAGVGGASTGGTTPTIDDVITTYMTIDVQQIKKIEYNKTSIATELKGVISKWYYNLTNLALLMLLIVLIYSGIRIVIGSTAGEKAKYKERIMDWLVAMCLIFIMHYIMVFAVTLNEKFVELIDSSHDEKGIIKYIHLEKENHINVVEKDGRLSEYVIKGNKLDPTLTSDMKFLQWPTNIMGGIRIEQQLVNEGTANWIGFSLCYLVLVAYTVIFSWTYLRRVLYMAFLTMIAPLVAMTYPIDKITDGKAQAFNSWLKEYIFNLLIQPFHLLLYTVLVTSAWELAGENALYALVAIGFMTPAEKLLRKFFGFEKAQTPGLLGGAAGAALAMSGLQSLMRFGDKGKNPENDEEEKSDIKFSSADNVSAKDTVLNSVTESGGTPSRQVHEENVDVENESDDAQQDDITRVRLNGERRTGNAGDEGNIEVIDNTTERTDNNSGRVTTTDVNLDDEENSEEESERDISIGIGGDRETPATAENFESPQKRGFWRAMGAGIGGVSRAYGQKTYKRMKKAKPIRALARGLAGVSGGLLLGMAGLALGIASGDPSKAFQYTTAGATGGFGVGKGLAGMGANALSVSGSDIKDEMDLAYYGADYKDAKLRQEQKALVYDEDAIKFIRRTCGVSRKDAKNILATTGARCYESDIKNIEDIAAIYQYEQEEIQKGYANIVNDKWEGWIEGELNRDQSWKNARLSPEEDAAVAEATKAKIAEMTEEEVNAEVTALAETEIEGDLESYKAQRQKELEEELGKIEKNFNFIKKKSEEDKKRRDEEIRLARKRAEAEIKRKREELIKQQEEEIRKRKSDMEALRRKKEEKVKADNEARIKVEYEEGIKRENARKRLIEDKKEAINEDIAKLRKEMAQGNTQRYQEFKENGFISGVAMSKYAKRVPDNYNQLGQDKVDKIDERFKQEFKADLIKQGMSEKQAEIKASEATEIVHNGIRQYMDKKDSLFTTK